MGIFSQHVFLLYLLNKISSISYLLQKKLDTNEKIALRIKRISAYKRRCCCPTCSETTNLAAVPLKTRVKVLEDWELYIPEGVKVCARHFDVSDWINAVDETSIVYEFNQRQIEDMVHMLRTKKKAVETPITKTLAREGNSWFKLLNFNQLLQLEY